MEPTFNEWQRPPRPLLYRSHYKWYALALVVFWGACVIAAATLGVLNFSHYRDEALCFGVFAILIPMVYLVWLHPKLTHSMQVFSDGVKISAKSSNYEIKFNDLVSVDRPFGSIIRLKAKDGLNWSFDSSLERLDYLWEALWRSRPELVGNAAAYEEFRLKLVQNDHHQKRKEWFFRHRLIDVLNWIVLPIAVMAFGYRVQSTDIVVHSPAFYFLRLGMFMLLAMICCSFIYSVLIKKFVFDKILQENIGSDRSKRRDMAHENVVVQRAKSAQLATCSFIMFSVLFGQLNLYSITRLKEGAQAFHLTPGKTAIIDNRFNCITCKHAVKEGDLMVFGKGTLGKILAMPGDIIAKTTETKLGRSIASETVHSVPEGHIALQVGSTGKDVVFVKIDDLVGKLKTP